MTLLQPPETRTIIQIGDSIRAAPSTLIQQEVIDISEEIPVQSIPTINFPPTPPPSGEVGRHLFADTLQELGVVYEEENFFSKLN